MSLYFSETIVKNLFIKIENQNSQSALTLLRALLIYCLEPNILYKSSFKLGSTTNSRLLHV
jgi:hypothetical protein